MQRILLTLATITFSAGVAQAEPPKRVAISGFRPEPISPPERFAPSYPNVLASADADRDGRVTSAELEALVVRHVGARIEHRFRRLDRSGDGRVGADEVPSMDRARFARLDVNHDGFFTAAELRAVLLAQATSRCRAVFAQLDRDRDGAISANDADAGGERFSRR